MSIPVTKAFKVGEWLVETELLTITKKEDVRKLEFMTMEILLYFVSHPGDVISKQRLHQEVWRDIYVTDNALTRAVSRLRKAFDDDPLNPTYIDTISKSGYRLVAPVVSLGEAEYEAKALTSITIAHKKRRWLLGLALLVVISGLSLMDISSEDTYSKFHDPVPISTLVGPEKNHAISPDGEKMSFTYLEPEVNSPDVYVKVLKDLSQVKFTRHESSQECAAWSPDGNYLAYVSLEDGGCGIYKEPVFGGEKIRIGDCYYQPRDLVWSPDGKTIAFSDIRDSLGLREIFFLNLKTRVSREILTSEGGQSYRNPAFSPDGQYLVFNQITTGQGGDLYKMRLSDRQQTRITNDNGWISGLDLFDNGKQIAFSSNRGGQWAIWRVPFDGGRVTRFLINDRVPLGPKFSEDGSRMIYRSVQDQTQLWLIEKEGATFHSPIPVASSSRAEMNPYLSSDEESLVFLSNRSGNFEIWSHSLKDRATSKLTSLNGSFLSMPSLSHNGSQVLFDARINGGNAIYVLEVVSKTVRAVIDLEGDQVNARFSRDGKTIYFGSNHSGSWQIWKKAVDGQVGITQVTSSGGYYLQEAPRDGCLYLSKWNVPGIWKLDKAGKETLVIPDLKAVDWGNWVPLHDGIIYLNREDGSKLIHHPYKKEHPAVSIFSPSKSIPRRNPMLSSNREGTKIIFAQMANSEDEIMMVDFK